MIDEEPAASVLARRRRHVPQPASEATTPPSMRPALRIADLLLFAVTAAELVLLFMLTWTFSVVDWIYVLQHVLVLAIAFTRRPPEARDHSLLTSLAVGVAYAYPYAQVALLRWMPGRPGWPAAGLVLVILGAALSLASLVSLGRRFGVRPALRGLATRGAYRLVRHPMYLAYLVADVGYNLQEWHIGTLLLVVVGWVSLIYRIHLEERVTCRHEGWAAYAASVRWRLVPGAW